jgi:hypothetical protein
MFGVPKDGSLDCKKDRFTTCMCKITKPVMQEALFYLQGILKTCLECVGYGYFWDGEKCIKGRISTDEDKFEGLLDCMPD